jgi:hypothetical protein
LTLKPYKTRTEADKTVRIEYRDGTFQDGPPRPALYIALDLIRAYPGSTQRELKKLARPHGLAEHRLVEALEGAVIWQHVDARKGTPQHISLLLAANRRAGIPAWQDPYVPASWLRLLRNYNFRSNTSNKVVSGVWQTNPAL